MKLFLSPEEVLAASFTRPPSFALGRPRSKGRKAEGLRFERKVQEALCESSELYLPGPWLRFTTSGGSHICQPDGLHFNPLAGRITIVEIKFCHTAEAHRQLRKVYAPVLRRMFPERLWELSLVEIVKWYDPDILFPEPVVMCSDPFNHSGLRIGVHIYRP